MEGTLSVSVVVASGKKTPLGCRKEMIRNKGIQPWPDAPNPPGASFPVMPADNTHHVGRLGGMSAQWECSVGN